MVRRRRSETEAHGTPAFHREVVMLPWRGDVGGPSIRVYRFENATRLVTWSFDNEEGHASLFGNPFLLKGAIVRIFPDPTWSAFDKEVVRARFREAGARHVWFAPVRAPRARVTRAAATAPAPLESVDVAIADMIAKTRTADREALKVLVDRLLKS